MNREILFRAKMWDGSKWVYGTFSYEEGGVPKIYELVWDENYHTYVPEEYDIIPETIGQYTGLTDRNGVKIFDGDVVKCDIDGSYEIGFVQWQNDDCRYLIETNKRLISMDYCPLEVIGNIHDNPELLQTGDASKEETK